MSFKTLLGASIFLIAGFAQAESTSTNIADHLLDQSTYDENQLDYNNAMRANIERLKQEIKHNLGIPDIHCTDYKRDDLRDCQKGLIKLAEIGYDSRVQDKNIESLSISTLESDGEFSQGGYRVTVNGDKSAKEIKKFLLGQRPRNEEHLIQMNTLGAMFQLHSKDAKDNLGFDNVGCWDYKHSDIRECRNGAKKLSNLGYDSKIRSKKFDNVYLSSHFTPAKFVGENYMVTVDANASEAEIRKFLQDQERKPRAGLTELRGVRSNYQASAGQAETNLGVGDIGCWNVTLESAQLCESGAAKLAEIGNSPEIQSRGIEYIYISNRFQPAEFFNGKYHVVIDGNAPAQEIREQIISQTQASQTDQAPAQQVGNPF